MRKSVEARKQTGLKVLAETQRRTVVRRGIIAVILIALIVLDATFIIYMQTTTNDQITAQHAAQAKQIADQRNARIQQMDAARSLETTAKKQSSSITAIDQQNGTSNTSGATHCDVTDPASLTVVVNKKHCINPVTWAPANISEVDGFRMRTIAATRMADMMQAAATASVPFVLTSGYRSYTDQQATYQDWISAAGTAAADDVSARPGFSEHQTGLAADIKVGNCVLKCVATTPTYAWLQEHASEYGFIQRYPAGLTLITGYSAEPWHWRYVGTGLASILKTEHIETLEAYFGITGGNY